MYTTNDGKLFVTSYDEEVTIHDRIGKIIELDEEYYTKRTALTEITFAPRAMAHLEFLRDYKGSPLEVSAYGVCLDPDNPLHVDELIVPKQENTSVSVDIDTEDFAQKVDEYMETYTDLNEDVILHPYQVNSVWIHTHPGNSASPSHVDDTTFKDKNPDLFFVMYILACGGEQHAEMKIKGLETKLMLKTSVIAEDEVYEPTAEDIAAWSKQYDECVSKKVYTYQSRGFKKDGKQRSGNLYLPSGPMTNEEWAQYYRRNGGYGNHGYNRDYRYPNYGSYGSYYGDWDYEAGTGYAQDDDPGYYYRKHGRQANTAELQRLITKIELQLDDVEDGALDENDKVFGALIAVDEIRTLLNQLQDAFHERVGMHGVDDLKDAEI